MKLLEVIVTTKEEAIAAEQGGADRLELIRAFRSGGLTPDIRLVEEVLQAVKIPVRVMVRENSSYEILDESELDTILERAERFSKLPINGLVLGYTIDGKIDVAVVKKILDPLPDVKVTFHRAFESAVDYEASVKVLKDFRQIDLILTNGGSGSWETRINRLERLQSLSGSIKFMVGGGVESAALDLLVKSRLENIHVGSMVRSPETVEGMVDASKVAAVRKRLFEYN
ncbi:MAG TPA: copper homeostasis protein CutC [Oculatellaceae cyanobacterium]